MSNQLRAYALVAVLPAIAGGIACNGSPSEASPPASSQLSLSRVSPNLGFVGTPVSIVGTGFQFGAAVTFDGVPAIGRVTSADTISVDVPAHLPGLVDVVVTNPDRESRTLTGGYSYEVVTLAARPNPVAAEGQLSVSWVAPTGRSRYDWIGFFKAGTPSTSYEDGWWDYTKGAASGEFTFKTPSQPGDYEFRYLLDDGYIDVARSSPVTVTP